LLALRSGISCRRQATGYPGQRAWAWHASLPLPSPLLLGRCLPLGSATTLTVGGVSACEGWALPVTFPLPCIATHLPACCHCCPTCLALPCVLGRCVLFYGAVPALLPGRGDRAGPRCRYYPYATLRIPLPLRTTHSLLDRTIRLLCLPAGRTLRAARCHYRAAPPQFATLPIPAYLPHPTFTLQAVIRLLVPVPSPCNILPLRGFACHTIACWLLLPPLLYRFSCLPGRDWFGLRTLFGWGLCAGRTAFNCGRAATFTSPTRYLPCRPSHYPCFQFSPLPYCTYNKFGCYGSATLCCRLYPTFPHPVCPEPACGSGRLVV